MEEELLASCIRLKIAVFPRVITMYDGDVMINLSGIEDLSADESSVRSGYGSVKICGYNAKIINCQ
jgi:hypothetical protein